MLSDILKCFCFCQNGSLVICEYESITQIVHGFSRHILYYVQKNSCNIQCSFNLLQVMIQVLCK